MDQIIMQINNSRLLSGISMLTMNICARKLFITVGIKPCTIQICRD